ncbi:MAG: phosphatase PAP2 family protein [Pseudomonadota bacterium]
MAQAHPSRTTRWLPARTAVALAPEMPLLLVCALYSLSVMVVAVLLGRPDAFDLFLYTGPVGLLLGVALFALIIARILNLALIERERQPIARLARDMKAHFGSQRTLFAYAVPIIAISLFVSAYTSFKGLIPALQPFAWDETLFRLDRAVHFGIDPWRLTHAVFGSASATLAINAAYNVWFGLLWLSLFVAVLELGKPRLRAHYLLSFALSWIVIGSLLALLFSSAGPCYYGPILGAPDPYAPLMARLHEIDGALRQAPWPGRLWVLETQNLLWTKYLASSNGIGAGISAMPSMHVATATLMALAAWRIFVWLGVAMTLYAAVILIGSVHLGWHYALDGYVSIALAIAIWKLVGWMLPRLLPGEARADSAAGA